jgi:predicted unusual protein kinase regulating ubiquinone biosynthesis (AarF/ABC1/UbiB family)
VLAQNDLRLKINTRGLGIVHLSSSAYILEPNTGLLQLFVEFDELPLASATVAQVHRAKLLDGRRVAVKVQHRGARRMMTSDLRQLRLLVLILDALRVDLGFDLKSVVLEYCNQVQLRVLARKI